MLISNNDYIGSTFMLPRIRFRLRDQCPGKGSQVHLTLRDTAMLNIYTASDWNTVTRDVFYTHDLETTPLQIKTDSAVGSEEKVTVWFYTADDGYPLYSGAISLKFTDPPKYYIGWCSEDWTTFPVDLPAEQIWTITETATTVNIACNEVDLVTYTFSDSSRSACVPTWSRDIVNIWFRSGDTASDEFRAKPGMLSSTRKANIGTNNVKL